MRHVLLLLLLSITPISTKGQDVFNYKKLLTGSLTLNANVSTLNRTTGEVLFTGSDSRGPSTPGLTFTWIWGDGTSNNGFFPQTKIYTDLTKNYTAKVVANYSATEKDTVELLVLFVKPKITPVNLNSDFAVFIPNQTINFSTHATYSVPTRPTYYTNDKLFSGNVSRADLAYILSVFNSIEVDMANNNVYRYNGKIQQYMLRDSAYGGASAFWFTDPFSFAVGDALLTTLDFSTLAHEMGHNITLNSPANYIFGGKIDGSANAIFSEAVAQIFQHTVGYIVLNNYSQYGFDSDYAGLMRQGFLADFGATKTFYDQYVNGGKVFASWNNPATSTDETLFTFGTIAYKFCQYAEAQNKGYLLPAKRLMQFLQRFNPEWQKRYDPSNNNPVADAFRATMMVAALSNAFQKDLRADFRALNFPISDSDWAFLNPALLDVSTNMISVSATASNTDSFSVISTATSWSVASSQSWLTPSVITGSGNQTVTLATTANTSITSRTALVTLSAMGFIDRFITVVQAGATPFLSTSTQSLSLTASAGPASVSITSNTSWSVISSQSWLSPAESSGTGNQELNMSATANPIAAPRSATLTISANGVSSQLVIVTQAGAPATLSASVTSLTVDAANGMSSVSITSNTSWSAVSSQPWLTVSPTAGLGTTTLTLTATANTVVGTRSAMIAVSANGVGSQTVAITQRGIIITGIVNPMEESLRIYPNPVSDNLQIEGLPFHSTIFLYDGWGRLLHQYGNTGATYRLATDAIPAGVYYLRVQNDQKTIGRQLIKRP